MKVFISWSGTRSEAVAVALREWLPRVIQSVRPWMSQQDIPTGARWSAEIASELSETRFGVICVTPENRDAPWLLFESGALAKTLDKTYVCPYLFDLEYSSLPGPLQAFQSAKCDKEGTRRLVESVNRALGDSRLSDCVLEDAFAKWWGDLEDTLARVPPLQEGEEAERAAAAERSDRDVIEEVLWVVRELHRLTWTWEREQSLDKDDEHGACF